MKIRTVRVFLAVVAGSLCVAGSAGAAGNGETATASLELDPSSGTLYTNAFKSAKFSLKTQVTSPDPDKISPTKRTKLTLPKSDRMTFNPPRSMPVCPDSRIGPDTNNSIEIPEAVAKCPKSILGNGLAGLKIAKNNRNPTEQGVVIAFNGGLTSQGPRIKFWAYSYFTEVGVYTEAVLRRDGVMDIPFPVLSNDSALTSLNWDMPGKPEQILTPDDRVQTLPAGQAPAYVQARCVGQTFPFRATLTLGERLDDGTPVPGTETIIPDIGENSPCTGKRAIGKLGSVKVKGPAKVKRNKTATYSVRIPNTSAEPAVGVRLSVKGRGVKFNTPVGTIPGRSSRTVKIKARFKSKGKIKATFNATSSNSGKKNVRRTITVR
jgi:hypothetical protein